MAYRFQNNPEEALKVAGERNLECKEEYIRSHRAGMAINACAEIMLNRDLSSKQQAAMGEVIGCANWVQDASSNKASSRSLVSAITTLRELL